MMTIPTEPLLIVHDMPLTDEEYWHHRCVRFKDLIGIPVIILWYWLLSSLEAPDEGFAEDSPPSAVLAGQAVLAFVACMVFFYDAMTWPATAEDDEYHSMKCIGRWLFLTRHCVALQAVHMVLSACGAAMGNDYLQKLSYGMTLVIAALGSFVTIQFFTLVHNHPDYLKKCDSMKNKRGFFGLLTFRSYVAAFHVPALAIALFDVLIAKRHSLLRGGGCSLQNTFCLLLFYVLFYTALIWCNFFATGYFPYGVLKELGTLVKWIGFMIVQTVLLAILVLCFLSLTFLPQPYY